MSTMYKILESFDRVQEKIEPAIKVDPAEKGKYKGKDIGDLKSMMSTIKDKMEAYRKRGGKVPDELRSKFSELTFAIRAKQAHGGKWGKIKEDDVEEGNDFTKARLDAIKAGKDSFDVDGKTYKVTGDTSDEEKMDEASCSSRRPMEEELDEMDMKIMDYIKNGVGPEDEEEIDIEDKGEYDQEGDMAENQLRTIEDAAAELKSIIDADDNLPEWVQSKITKAMDYLDTARDYMSSNEKEAEELDEKAVSKSQQQAAGIALAAKRKDETPPGKGAAAQMAKMSTKELEKYASTKHKGLPDKVEEEDDDEEKVDETTTSGSVAATDSAPKSKSNSMFGKGIYESKYENAFKIKLSEQLNEGVTLTMNQPDQGEPSVSVTGTGEDAMKLGELLKLAGMFSSSGYSQVQMAEESNLANSADNTMTMDTNYMTNDIAGGLNGPKQQVNPNNPGDNPLAMTKLGKTASPNLNLGEIAEEVENKVKNHLVDLYKRIS